MLRYKEAPLLLYALCHLLMSLSERHIPKTDDIELLLCPNVDKAVIPWIHIMQFRIICTLHNGRNGRPTVVS